MLLDDGLATGFDALRFVAEEAGGPDVLLEVGEVGAGEVRRAAVFSEQFGGDQVDPFVSALSRKDGRDE